MSVSSVGWINGPAVGGPAAFGSGLRDARPRPSPTAERLDCQASLSGPSWVSPGGHAEYERVLAPSCL